MSDLYVTPGIDAQKCTDDAYRRSKEGDATTIHWHSAKLQCEAKYKHLLYADGICREIANGAGDQVVVR